MRVLVIGGTSFIGAPCVRRLHHDGHEVAVFHRGQTEVELPAGIRHIHADRADLLDHRQHWSEAWPDVVLDIACYTEREATIVREAFVGRARRLVTLSSLDVYRAYDVLRGKAPGPPEPVPLTEDAPLRDQHFPYGTEYDKILVERVVLGEPRLTGTVLRLPAVYGPGDTQHRLFADLKRMDDGRPAILFDAALARWRWSRSYVENVATAVALTVADERAAGQVYNVADAYDLPLGAWVEAVGRVAGWRGRVVALPRDRLPTHRRPDINPEQHVVLDTTRIRRDLGYVEPVGLDDALRETIAWQRTHPPADVDVLRFDYAAEDAALARYRNETT
jgi:nucleoside-diphosphate-sugar epimerase